MNQSKSGPGGGKSGLGQFGWTALFLVVLLGLLFWEGLLPGHTVFSNDGPLGQISSRCARMPDGFFGYWQDLSWIGSTGPSASPDITGALSTVLGPLIFSKVYAPFACLFLGLSAWFCFRQWKLAPVACVLGGIAAALNSDFFSTACWGVASQPICFGLNFLALAALADETSPRRWVRVALAGLAVGMGVMEAFDIGAIFSIMVAAFVIFQSLAGKGPAVKKLALGARRLGVVVVFAGFIAASAVSSLVSTQIKGVAGMGQDSESRAQRWDEATEWSLPKAEALSLVVPGLFGYRMDTPGGGNYWGRCGRHGIWDRYFASGKTQPRPDAQVYFLRYGGGGLYTGIVVVVVALWTILQSLRKTGSVFLATEQKFIYFWSGVALVCLLVAFGRFAPFYQIFYALPFASTMRNPSKFTHVVEWILVILFAYGVHGLARSYLEAPTPSGGTGASSFKAWWARAAAFDKKWVWGSLIALVAVLVGWWIYDASRERLVAYLQEVDFDAATAGAIASFSIRQVGWFIPFLALALGLVVLFLSGTFSGRRARMGALLLGLLLAVDLARANVPWVVTWNWEQKYASNPVIDFLRDKPYEHRVAVLPFQVPPDFALFSGEYEIEWKQQIFPYYNIQCLDEIMNPRPREDELAFRRAMLLDGSTNSLHRITRNWELTNTRYLLGPAGFLDVLNQQVDPVKHRFRIAATFALEGKPGIEKPATLEELTANLVTNGPYAVFEFTGALPRAKLYSNWQVSTNDQATLKELGSAAFDPQQRVLVADALPKPPTPSGTGQDAGRVQFASYAPKDIVLKAEARTPAVLLLNDRFDENWHVSVDGKPEKVLRCNYLMRGVYLQPGSHTVEFRFAPPIGTLYVSLAAVGVAVLLLGYLGIGRTRQTEKPQPLKREPLVNADGRR